MVTETTVVHLSESHDIRIDRTSLYGNPFRIGVDGNRETVIRLHMKQWRAFLTGGNGKYALHLLQQLKGQRLGCHCKPKSCHGDNYVKLIAEFCS